MTNREGSITPEEEFKLNAEVRAFQFGQAVRRLNDERRKAERDLKIEEWTKYRDSLPRHIRGAIVTSYRSGYGEDED